MSIFTEQFASFSKEAFRIETLPEYKVAEEWPHFQAYLAGKPTIFDKNAWHSQVQEHKAAGRQIVRLRLLPEDITPYIEYELLAYQQNLLAGEEIYFLDEDTCAEILQQEPRDFWMFDETTLLEMHYDENGQYRDATLEQSVGTLQVYKELRGMLAAEAIPSEEFFRSLRG